MNGLAGENERKRKWAEQNREHIREQRRSPEYRARQREYVRDNPHLKWESKYRRRCRKYGFEVVIVRFTREDLIERYGDHCHWCGTPEWAEIDHVIEVRDGGRHTLDNVRPSCTACNKRRAGKAQTARTTRCKRGHEFTAANTYTNGKKRYCRTCRVARTKRWRAETAALTAVLGGGDE